MWFLTTLVYLALVLAAEGMGFRWTLLHRLPLIGPWSKAHPIGFAFLEFGVQIIGFAVVHVFLWILGIAINWFAEAEASESQGQEVFDRWVQLVHSRENILPVPVYVLVLVPLSLLIGWYVGHLDAVPLFMGLLLALSAAYVIRPFSFLQDLFPALRGLPGRFLREQIMGVPPSEGPEPPSEEQPPSEPEVSQPIEGEWYAAGLGDGSENDQSDGGEENEGA